MRTGAGLSLQGLWGDIPPVDSELHLDRPTMVGWQQPGLFKHVKAKGNQTKPVWEPKADSQNIHGFLCVSVGQSFA